MKNIWVALGVFCAITFIGMAGAVPPVQLSTGHKLPVDAGKMDKLYEEFVAEDQNRLPYGEAMPAPYLGAVAKDAQGRVIDSIFAGDGIWYPSVAELNIKYTFSDAGVMETPTKAQEQEQAPEYAANPMSIKGQPFALYDTGTASGQGIPHGWLVQESPELAAA